MSRQSSGHARAAYEEATGALPVASRLIVVVSCAAAIGALVYGLRMPQQHANPTPGAVLSPAPVIATAPASSSSPVPPTRAPTPSASLPPSVPRIGIVAGHHGNDVGAMCPDGLTEAEINLEVARRVVYVLEALGYQADLLEEFDTRLTGYQANALISIHADSCEDFPNATPPASGFKIASVEDSIVPDAEERLVNCLAQCYAARTHLYFHANSITYDMTRYHTFYEIDGRTPAAIIEIGFMRRDRQILTERPDLVAQGIVDGIVCFLKGD